MWKLSNTHLSNQLVKEEITKEIRKYLETNEKENTTYQNLWETKSTKREIYSCNAYTKKDLKSIIELYT